MGEIIMNEREWAECALRTLAIGDDPVFTLNILAKYYHARGCDRATITRLLRDFLLRCEPMINIDMWTGIIESRAANAKKYPLVEVNSIDITESEFAVIKSANGSQKQRVLFTLLCLAKFLNASRDKNRNWVNVSYREIFQCAGITLSKDRQAVLIGDLWREGFVKLSHIVDNTNVNVSFIDQSSPVCLTIYDLRNLGNQYLRYLGEPYIECQECGITIRKRSNRQKYCRRCSRLGMEVSHDPVIYSIR